jgi:hypothetical protein
VGAGGAAASTPTGYRLAGTDMQPFVGQRVQLTGTLTPTQPSTASATGSGTSATGAATTPEFRVVSVRPLGSCPQQ